MEELNGIKIEGYRGKWHSIDSIHFGTHTLFLMEHDYYGDLTHCLIVDENKRLICEEVWNGFDDFYDIFDDYNTDLYEHATPIYGMFTAADYTDARIDYILDKMHNDTKE